MEPKKISFGFMKTKKLEKPAVDDKKDYIDCVEEKSIKIVGGEEIKECTPLVIPMKPNTLITAERLKQIAETVESALEDPEVKTKIEPEEIKPENETLDQMAVRELLQDANREVKVETAELTLPVPSKPVIDGQKESTIEDYEAVPVQDFGMAMLRGMGWTPNKEQSKYKQPELRPKGLGLGADKVIKENQKKKSKDSKDEELTIVKNAFVLITTGKYSGYYGKVVSLDEDNGRVMVDITVKKETVSLSEFMLHPVSKSEYDKESKVINADKFVEYKRNEKIKQSSNSKQKSSNQSPENIDDKKKPVEKPNDNRQKEKPRSCTPEDSSRNRRKEHRRSTNTEDRSYNTMKTEKRSNSPDNSGKSYNTKEKSRHSSPKEKMRNRRKENRSSSGSEDRSRNRHKTEIRNNSFHDSKFQDVRRERRRSTSISRERTHKSRRHYSSSSSEEKNQDRDKKDKRNNSPEKEMKSRNARRERSKEISSHLRRYSRSSSNEDARQNRKDIDKRNYSPKKDIKSRSTRRERSSTLKRDIRSSSSEDRSRNRHKERRKSPNNDQRHRKKESKYSSNESLSSLSDSDKRNKKKDKKKKPCSESDSDDYKSKKSDGKRDIDKKRKGKKKKRDRDRSPNYKKHKK